MGIIKEASINRELAWQRSKELKERIMPYLKARKKILSGLNLEKEYAARKEKILNILDGTEKNWNDWHWQIRNRIDNSNMLRKIIDLTDQEIKEIEKVSSRYRWAISPYYASLIAPDDPNDPIRLQAVPSIQEYLDTQGKDDPMAEMSTSPAPLITRRYGDRLIINITNMCAMFCRHCQRRRNIGEVDLHSDRGDIAEALSYIQENPEIRDVLITGGDPFTLPDEALEYLLVELEKIPHVEIKRFGTRTPVTLPQRITEELCQMLSRHLPLYINTQFNHPREVTRESQKACLRLARAGVGLGNQAVLLKGINNDPHIMKKLNHELLKCMVRPYYIFHAKLVRGTSHFIPRVEEGIEIMEQLRGYTSGLAVPTYIINAPDGHGKTPILPQYLVSIDKKHVTFRNWEGKFFKYPNP
ncbi:MAG: glutamate 2,3-aminomutase [Dethiobacteria bacterium]|jgi:glutamate 2,3-aminomutase